MDWILTIQSEIQLKNDSDYVPCVFMVELETIAGTAGAVLKKEVDNGRRIFCRGKK